MKRSEINTAMRRAATAFKKHGWALPPNPRWDVTDFGLCDFKRSGLVLINLAEQKEYCEKLMFVDHKQVTPIHYHAAKKEDIICRWGKLAMMMPSKKKTIRLQVNGEFRNVPANRKLVLTAGERVTLAQRIPHTFWAESKYAIVGEVSTANNDTADNFFADKNIGRYSKIDEDVKPLAKLVSD